MTLCENCEKSAYVSRNEFYSDSLTAVKQSLSHTLPAEIMNIIVGYAYVSEVKILWVTKLNIFCKCAGCRYDRLARYPNNFSGDSDDDTSSSDDDEKIQYECKRRQELSMILCAKCFVEGIERSPGRLPYMKHHIETRFLTNSYIETNPYKYILPNYYKLFTYRSSSPTEHNGQLIISCQ